MAVLIQIDGWDQVAGAAVALNIASEDDDRICMLDGKLWWPVAAKLPALRYDLFSGQFDGKIDTPGSSLSVAIEPWPNFGRYALADARCRIWQAAAGTAWPWALLFDGRVTAQPPIAGGIATLSIAVDDRWLDAPLLAIYAGSGGAEGHAGLNGTPKPLALGAPRYVPGVLIDAVNTVVQLSNGAINGVEAALERLLRFGAVSGDYAGYAALVAATVPPGAWATAKAVGLVRHGAPPAPSAKLSYLVQGDSGGAAGWVRKPGALIARVCEIAGLSAKVNAASMAALDTARPWNLSILVEQQTTIREIVQRIAASVNAVAGVSWTGQLFAAPVAIGAAAALTLQSDGSALPAVARAERRENDPPEWRGAIQAVRAWAVHSLDEIAFTAQLVDVGAYSATTVYREGNIAHVGAATWLYINPTPSAGNAPPSTGIANSFWQALGAAGSVLQGSANYDPGNPGVATWHSPPVAGDTYLRASTDGGATFGAAFALGTDSAAILAEIARIQSDAWLSAGEKPQVVADYNAILNEGSLLAQRATDAGIGGFAEVTNLSNARTDLTNYLGGLGPPYNSLTTNTPLPASPAPTMYSYFVAYYAAKELLEKAIGTAQKGKTDTLANQIAAISSDGVLAKGEKRDAKQIYNGLVYQFTSLDAKYSGLGSPASLQPVRDDAFTWLYTNLTNTYLNTLVPAWDDAAFDTTISRTNWDAYWNNTRQKLEIFAAAITAQPGPAGADAIVVKTSAPPTFNMGYTAAGGAKGPFAGAGGTATLWRGSVQITSGVAWSTANPVGVGGLAITSPGGVHSLTSLTADKGGYDVVATYAGQTYSLRLDTTRTSDGAAGQSGIPTSRAIPSGGGVPTPNSFGGAQSVIFMPSVTIPAGTSLTISVNLRYRPNWTGSTNRSVTLRGELYANDGGGYGLLASADGSPGQWIVGDGPDDGYINVSFIYANTSGSAKNVVTAFNLSQLGGAPSNQSVIFDGTMTQGLSQ